MNEEEIETAENAQALRQELINEENDRKAEQNPVFREERETAKKAMKILDDAGLPFVLFFESSAYSEETGDPKDKIFVQYNNWKTQSEKIEDKTQKFKTISAWWYKLAWALMGYMDGLGNPKNNRNHNAINFIIRANNTPFKDYLEQEDPED